MSNCCPCSDNGCGASGTSGAHTITLGHGTAHLRGASPPPGGFASTGSQHLSSAQASISLGQHDPLAAVIDFALLLILCVCVHVCVLDNREVSMYHTATKI